MLITYESLNIIACVILISNELSYGQAEYCAIYDSNLKSKYMMK